MERIEPEAYEELRSIARNYMQRERASHTLQPTALVHEALMRLDRPKEIPLVARTMRRILVDHARRKAAKKRGGDARRVTLPPLTDEEADPIDLIALGDALDELADIDDQKCRIVELLFFVGLNVPETAEVLGIGRRTVEENWAMARTWLRARLG
ncbi:MAG: ECF-type sigma factor [Planctomycetota bacterium]|jgi:RNA polymerase sigma factor (TIGR02999 family)